MADTEEIKAENTEIDYNSLDPSKIPHEIVQQTQAFSGLLGETQQSRQTAAALQLQLNDRAAKDEAPAEDDDQGDPEDFVTKGDMARLLDNQREEIKKEQAVKEAANLQGNQNKATAAFASKMKAEETGPGLDVKTVISETSAHLKAHDPEMFELLMKKPDAAERLYQYGIATIAEIRDRDASHRNEKFLASLKTGGGPKGGGTGDGASGNELLKMLEAPDDVLLEQAEQEETG